MHFEVTFNENLVAGDGNHQLWVLIFWSQIVLLPLFRKIKYNKNKLVVMRNKRERVRESHRAHFHHL